MFNAKIARDLSSNVKYDIKQEMDEIENKIYESAKHGNNYVCLKHLCDENIMQLKELGYKIRCLYSLWDGKPVNIRYEITW